MKTLVTYALIAALSFYMVGQGVNLVSRANPFSQIERALSAVPL